jgi:hypothetical protein
MSFYSGSIGAPVAFDLKHLYDLNSHGSISSIFTKEAAMQKDFIRLRGKVHPGMTRLTGPLVAISGGLLLVVAGITRLAEGIFKSFAKLIIGVYSTNYEAVTFAAKATISALVRSSYLTLMGIKFATLGSIGLILEPQWTCREIMVI